jgi:hypothetical protein
MHRLNTNNSSLNCNGGTYLYNGPSYCRYVMFTRVDDKSGQQRLLAKRGGEFSRPHSMTRTFSRLNVPCHAQRLFFAGFPSGRSSNVQRPFSASLEPAATLKERRGERIRLLPRPQMTGGTGLLTIRAIAAARRDKRAPPISTLTLL